MFADMLNKALEQTSLGGNAEIIPLLQSMRNGRNFTAGLPLAVADWKIRDFYYKSCRFTAAYSKQQEAVMILTIKPLDKPQKTVLNSSLQEVEKTFIELMK